MDNELKKCKEASYKLEKLSDEDISICLVNIKEALLKNKDEIIKQNEIDYENAKGKLSPSMLDRLLLNEKRIKGLCDSIDVLLKLPNHIGEVIEEFTSSGLNIKKVRVPFGVILAIFEARPNVIVDIACLSLKTKNAAVLKGGSDAINTNRILTKVMQDAIMDIIDSNVITFVDSTDRKTTDEIITKKDYIDLLIPRGSRSFIKYIISNAKIPYIETGAGNNFIYVDKDVDIDMALKVIVNAKVQRPSVCNAIEHIIINDDIVKKFLPLLNEKMKENNVKMLATAPLAKIIKCDVCDEEEFDIEYNDYILSVMSMNNIDDVITYINNHSTHHSDCILSNNKENVSKFFNGIDSACVYHNASTRFTDGGCFGFGAEIGISTSKLHARGPMGLKEITTFKYVIEGEGNIRE